MNHGMNRRPTVACGGYTACPSSSHTYRYASAKPKRRATQPSLLRSPACFLIEEDSPNTLRHTCQDGLARCAVA